MDLANNMKKKRRKKAQGFDLLRRKGRVIFFRALAHGFWAFAPQLTPIALRLGGGKKGGQRKKNGAFQKERGNAFWGWMTSPKGRRTIFQSRNKRRRVVR